MARGREREREGSGGEGGLCQVPASLQAPKPPHDLALEAGDHTGKYRPAPAIKDGLPLSEADNLVPCYQLFWMY